LRKSKEGTNRKKSRHPGFWFTLARQGLEFSRMFWSVFPKKIRKTRKESTQNVKSKGRTWS
jgi:hypothetical protein